MNKENLSIQLFKEALFHIVALILIPLVVLRILTAGMFKLNVWAMSIIGDYIEKCQK